MTVSEMVLLNFLFIFFNRSSCAQLFAAYTLHILEVNERCARKMRKSRDLSDTRV